MTVIGEAYLQLKPDDTGLAAAVNNSISKVLSALGPVGIGAGIAAAIGGGLLDIGEKFQVAYNTIAQQTGAVGAQLQGLETDFKNVFSTAIGANFKNVAADLSEVAIRTGLTGPPLDKLTKQFVELGKMDPTANVQDLTSVFGQFNIAADQQSRELDVLFKAHQLAGVSVGQFSSDMKAAIPTAQMLGLTLDQTAAMTAQLDKLGLPVQKTMMGLSSEFAKAAKAGMDPTAVIGSMIQQIKQAPTATAAATLAVGEFGVGARQAATLVEALRSGVTNFGATLGIITSGKGGIDATAKATETLGEKFQMFKNDALVAIEPVAAKVLDFADRVMTALPGAFRAVSDAMRPFIQEFNDISDFLSSHREIMLGTLGGLAFLLAPVIVTAAGSAAVALATFIGEAVIATAPILAVVAVVAALGTGIVYLVENWDAVWGAMKDATSASISFIEAQVERFGGDLQRAFDNVFNPVKRIALQGLDDIVGFFTSLPGRIGRQLAGLYNTGFQAVTGLLNGIENKASDVYNWFINLPNRVVDDLRDAIHWLEGIGYNAMIGFYNGILKGRDAIRHTITTIPGEVVGWFEHQLGIASPSTVFHEMGLNLMQGLANGITASRPLARTALDGLGLNVPALGASPSASPASPVNTQLLALLTEIRNNTDPNHPTPQQQTALLDDIKRNTDPNRKNPAPTNPGASIAFEIAR